MRDAIAIALAFDCSAAHCAAALLSEAGVLAIRAEAMTKGQAERLMPMLEELLAQAAIGWADLAVIGVGIGPGSFTGTRIAVAAARGLSLGLSIPAIGVSRAEIAGASEAADIAVAIGRVALHRRDVPAERPAPAYARPADAVPARDRGPVILPA